MPLLPEAKNCDPSVKKNFRRISRDLGYTAIPTWKNLQLTDLTASSLVGTNASKVFESVTIGTGLDYTRPTLSLSHLGIENLTDPGADRILFWDDSETACKWLAVGNSIVITTTTIDTIQDIRTIASPTLAGLTLTNAAVIGSDSVVFQPNADSTTFVQIKNAAGTQVFDVDTTNGRVGIGVQPNFKLEVDGIILNQNTQSFGTRLADTTAVNLFTVSAANDLAIGSGVINNTVITTGASMGLSVGAVPLAVFIQTTTGYIGIGAEYAPETLIEMTHATPFLTLHSNNPGDADGDRLSRLNFKGHQSGGEETTLARIEIGHDGVADDEKGYFDIFINDGDDGDSPTKVARFDAGIGAGALSLYSSSTVGPTYELRSSANGINFGLEFQQFNDRIVLSGQTANASTELYIGAQVGKDAILTLHSSPTTFSSIIHQGSTDNLLIENDVEDGDIIFIVDDGGVAKTIKWDAGVDQLIHSAGVFNFNSGMTIGDGGTTNFTKIEADGTIEFNGAATVWEDLQFTISDAKVPASNFPTWETFTTNTKEYSFAVNDYIDTKANETHHAWKLGTNGNVHLHVTTKAANSTGSNRYAKFTIYLSYCDTGEAWQETSLTAELTIPDGTSALQMFYLDIGDLTLTNYVMEAEIKMRVSRIAATGGTEYAGNIFLTQAGIHLEHDTIGSRTETTK